MGLFGTVWALHWIMCFLWFYPPVSKTEAVTLRSYIMSRGLRPGWFESILGWFGIVWDDFGRVWFGMPVWDWLGMFVTVWVPVWECVGPFGVVWDCLGELSGTV